jgi:hypothetical protein
MCSYVKRGWHQIFVVASRIEVLVCNYTLHMLGGAVKSPNHFWRHFSCILNGEVDLCVTFEFDTGSGSHSWDVHLLGGAQASKMRKMQHGTFSRWEELETWLCARTCFKQVPWVNDNEFDCWKKGSVIHKRMSYIIYSGVNLTSLSSTYQSLSISQQALPLSRKANLLHQGKSQYSNTIITDINGGN